MIRVLHYGMSPNLGGIETYLLNLAKTIDSSGFQFDFLYSDQGQEPVFAGELTPRGSRFFGVTPRRVSPRRNRADLEALFDREPFDILHFHANTASYVEPVRAALRHGVKVVFHSHNAGASRSRVTRLLHRWNQRTLRWSGIARVAVSGEAGHWMFGSRPFDLIHNGIDVDAFTFRPEARARLRVELGVPPGSLLVGHVGAFLPAKNHPFLLDVFAEVLRLRPDARLALAGSGPDESKIRQRTAAMDLEDSVLFLGRRPDIPDVLSAIDCLVFPSLHEGFGLVAVEAQASGLPCIVSEAIPPEVTLSGHCRRLLLKDSPTVWAQHVVDSHSEDRRTGLAEVAEAGFTITANTRAVADLYRSVTAAE